MRAARIATRAAAALVLLLAFLATSPASAQRFCPDPFFASPCAAVTAASGNVAAASATATLPGAAGKTTYITGFEVTSTGATAASGVNVTVTGTISGTLTYVYPSVAGATAPNAPLVVEFGSPIPASGLNTAITVTLPSLGAGNTNAAVVAHGVQL